MAKFKNNVEITGYVKIKDDDGSALEIRATKGGTEVCNLTVSTPEYAKGDNGEYELKNTEFHRICVWNRSALATIRNEKIGDGDLVSLTGKLQTRKWTPQDGVDRWITEVTVLGFHTFELVEKSKGDGKKGKNAPKAQYGGGRHGLDDEAPF